MITFRVTSRHAEGNIVDQPKRNHDWICEGRSDCKEGPTSRSSNDSGRDIWLLRTASFRAGLTGISHSKLIPRITSSQWSITYLIRKPRRGRLSVQIVDAPWHDSGFKVGIPTSSVNTAPKWNGNSGNGEKKESKKGSLPDQGGGLVKTQCKKDAKILMQVELYGAVETKKKEELRYIGSKIYR